MIHRPASLARILDSSSKTIALLRQAQEYARCTERVRRLLPADISPHLAAARQDGARLVLFAASPAWASRIRFASSDLRRAMPELGDIRIRVLPASRPPRRKAARGQRGPSMSRETAEQILSIAGTVADPELSAALARLADHGEPA